MNMLLLEKEEIGIELPRNDKRVQHIIKILKKKEGDCLLAGIINGDMGSAKIEKWDGQNMTFSFISEKRPKPLYTITLLLGFPRPIQASRILKDLTTLGISRIIMTGTELGEKSYFESDFFKNKEYKEALKEGATQAANPNLPTVETSWTLKRSIKLLDENPVLTKRIVLDPYRAEYTFLEAVKHCLQNSCDKKHENIVIAIGSERGWTNEELNTLGENGFIYASLGDRILKTETASAVSVSIALAEMGWL